MKIIAHRGFWEDFNKRNTKEAFIRAAEYNFGAETDIRDYGQELKIAHDIPTEENFDALSFFEIFKNKDLPLAINIKSDGLQKKILEHLKMYNIKNYFCFDMSIPDMIGYAKNNIRFFVRESEYEPLSELYKKAEGVWMDGFIGDEWITQEKICEHLKSGKKVCIVSPELHGRPYEEQWELYRFKDFIESKDIYLCTDFPEKARTFFDE